MACAVNSEARDPDLYLRLRPLPGLEPSFCELGEKTARSARSGGSTGRLVTPINFLMGAGG